jgi:hypothetical protein
MKRVATIIALFTTALHADVTIVREGKVAAVIVLPDRFESEAKLPATRLSHESLTVALAAVELADYLSKSTGTRPAIVPESKAPAPGIHSRLFVGPCKATLELLAESTPAEEWIVRTRGNDLYLIGGDLSIGGMPCRGTLFAVYDFLEREIGVRWLFPGELGEVVPRHKDLVLPVIDRREQPRIEKRKIRNQSLTREDTFAPILESWGLTVEAWKAAHSEAVYGPWFSRMKLGMRVDIDGGHAYSGWWEKYGKTHPEWFALQPDGTRTQKPVRERLCKSNPALWDEIARVKIEEFRADPELLTASICPNDGGANQFCVCEACRALDPAGLDSESLSDRVFTFYNEIAIRVARERPDRSLVAYAYSVYRDPPVRMQALSPNLIIGFVGLDQPSIEAWSRIAPKLYIRPNDLGPVIDLGMPRNHAAHLARSVKFAVEHKAVGFDFDNCHGNWSNHGLDYFILAKALQNPELDVRSTIADYCQSAYGAGAEAMGRYYDRLEKISDSVRADTLLKAKSPYAARLRTHYSGKALDELVNEIKNAREAIGTGDSAALARLEMAAEGVNYARLVTALLEVAHEKKSTEYANRYRAVETFLKSKVLTPELAPLHSYRYLRMALAYVEREVE